jgi:hypothetical protein
MISSQVGVAILRHPSAWLVWYEAIPLWPTDGTKVSRMSLLAIRAARWCFECESSSRKLDGDLMVSPPRGNLMVI